MRGERPWSIRAAAAEPALAPRGDRTAEWTGTPLWPLIEEAGPTAEAIELAFRGADRGFQNQDEHDYGRSLSLADARRPEVMLVYAMNGEPLQPQHGFPLRLLVPGWYGMTSVKWLTSIEAISEPFDGYQQAIAYHYKRDADDPGEPVTRLRVRALMIPPGIPDFFTRQRVADAGRIHSPVVPGPATRRSSGSRSGSTGSGATRRSGPPVASSPGVRGRSTGTPPSANTSCLPRHGRRGQHPAARPAVELPGSRQQLGAALHRHRSLTDGRRHGPARSTRRILCQTYGQSRGGR